MGGRGTSRLISTGEKLDNHTRMGTEEDCDAVLILNAMNDLRRVLVPLRVLENARQIAPFIADLCRDATATGTALHVVEDKETKASSWNIMLRPVAEQTTQAGAS